MDSFFIGCIGPILANKVFVMLTQMETQPSLKSNEWLGEKKHKYRNLKHTSTATVNHFDFVFI